ncbi:hypothetical protein N7467_002568 [Penicillium canescens]|nr:hypothetical protein N7467_002568 [Penicillium canescens]
MDHEGAKWPCVVGNTIELHLNIPYNGRTTKATIMKVFEPFALSCVMVVRLTYSTLALEGDIVLKLFDRHLATQLREDEMIKPWPSDIEKGHHRFMLDGSAAKFIHMLNTDHRKASEDSDTWTDSQNEADAHEHMSGFYKSEVQVYNTLKDIQDIDIIKHFACVASASISTFLESFCSTMKGFAWLTLLAAHAPRESWQFICEDAIRIVNIFTERGILNLDVRTRSFIVRGNMGNEFKPVMIDFALCNFSRGFEDERRLEAMEVRCR